MTTLSKAPEGRTSRTLSPFQHHGRFEHGNRRNQAAGRLLDQRYELSPLGFILKYGKNRGGIQNLVSKNGLKPLIRASVLEKARLCSIAPWAP